LTPQKASGGGEGASSGPLKVIISLQENIPDKVDMFALKQKLKGDDNPLNVVLVQEIQRYNILLNKLIISLD